MQCWLMLEKADVTDMLGNKLVHSFYYFIQIGMLYMLSTLLTSKDAIVKMIDFVSVTVAFYAFIQKH